MFTTDDRSQVRNSLVAHARIDPKISGAAIVGSGARDEEDQWSDIDLALQLETGAAEPPIVEDWTDWITKQFGVADTLDIFAGGVRYRVLLLSSSLQIDLSFWPHDQFRATETKFQLLFGTANDPTVAPTPDHEKAIGMGWLYALHARSAIARGKVWQAVMMLDELRNQVIALMCLRLDLNAWHGRDADRLPEAAQRALRQSHAGFITTESLDNSLIALSALLLTEIEWHDPKRAELLRAPFAALSANVR